MHGFGKSERKIGLIDLFDNLGKLLEMRRVVMPGQTFQLDANYASGRYYAELQQRSNRKVVKLLKQANKQQSYKQS